MEHMCQPLVLLERAPDAAMWRSKSMGGSNIVGEGRRLDDTSTLPIILTTSIALPVF